MKGKKGLNVIRVLYLYENTPPAFVGGGQERREETKTQITLMTCWVDLFCLWVEDLPVNVKSFLLLSNVLASQ